MNESRGGAAYTWLILGIVWVAIAAFDFSTVPEKGGYTLSNTRLIAALIATGSAAASFVAFRHARRSHA